MSDPFSKTVPVDGVRGGENLFLGVLAGVVAALIGAIIWALITVTTGLHVGYVALGVGALVGISIRTAGKGTTPVFGIIGAILTLIGCLLGEIFATLQQMATPQNSLSSLATSVDYPELISAILAHTGPITYFIYAIGIYEGYKLSIRK